MLDLLSSVVLKHIADLIGSSGCLLDVFARGNLGREYDKRSAGERNSLRSCPAHGNICAILCVHVLLTAHVSAGNDIRESHGSQCACRESAPFARRVDFMWSESLVDVSDGRAIAQRLSWLQRCVV